MARPKGRPTKPTEALMGDKWKVGLLAEIRRSPGNSLRELQRATGFAWTQVSYKVDELEEAGLARTVRVGDERRVFDGSGPADLQARIALLRWGRSKLVIDAVLIQPGVRQKELLERVNMPRNSFRLLTDQLVRQGLVNEVTRGPNRFYYPGPDLGDTLAAMPRRRSNDA